MLEDNILSEIYKRLVDDKQAVTYPWLQKTFHFSPKEAQKYLRRYTSQVNEVNVEYLKTVFENFESSVIISLKPNSEYVVDLSQYDILSSTGKSKHSVICKEANCVPRPIITNINVKPTIELLTKVVKIQKKEINNFFPITEIKTDSKLYKPSDISKVTDPTKKVIHPTKKVKNSFISKTNKESTIKTKVKESTLNESSKKRYNLFENFENESPDESKNKRRRLIIESEDEDDISDYDNILVNNSMIEENPMDVSPEHTKPKVEITRQDNEVVCARKILKQVERTFLDDEGFLVTKKVSEDFSFTEEVKEEIKNKSPPKRFIDTKVSKKVIKKAVNGSHDVKKNTQMNLMNYFQKKN